MIVRANYNTPLSEIQFVDWVLSNRIPWPLVCRMLNTTELTVVFFPKKRSNL